MLEVKNIHKKFGSNEVLKGVDFKVEKGSVIAVLGNSGSGKTTLLRCISFWSRQIKEKSPLMISTKISLLWPEKRSGEFLRAMVRPSSTLSSAVLLRKRLYPWKTKPIFIRNCRISFLVTAVISLWKSSKVISPLSACSRKLIQRRRVVFPEPLFPRTAITEPFSTLKSTPFNTLLSITKFLYKNVRKKYAGSKKYP